MIILVVFTSIASFAFFSGLSFLEESILSLLLSSTMIFSIGILKPWSIKSCLLLAALVLRSQTRKNLKLSQAELAKMIGTQQSVISRLEDADYQGHTLTILQKIAQALGKELQFRMVDAR